MKDIFERMEVEVGPGERVIIELGDRHNPKVRYVNDIGYVPPAAEMHAAIVGLYKLAQEIIGLSEKTGQAVPEEYITLMEWCKSELGDEV